MTSYTRALALARRYEGAVYITADSDETGHCPIEILDGTPAAWLFRVNENGTVDLPDRGSTALRAA